MRLRTLYEEKEKGWIGVDLDGTLAVDDGWQGIEHIGPPIPRMVSRIKRWLKQGKTAKILTARVAGSKAAEKYIRAYCKEHIGRELPVTSEKDKHMIELWDDRVRRVEKNTGKEL